MPNDLEEAKDLASSHAPTAVAARASLEALLKTVGADFRSETGDMGCLDTWVALTASWILFFTRVDRLARR